MGFWITYMSGLKKKATKKLTSNRLEV
jgi:hypothetical protein